VSTPSRILRALLLALVLPALLVPSGWSAHVCLCGMFSGPLEAETCCVPEIRPEPERSCCSAGAEERESLPTEGGSACSHGDGANCCRLVEAEHVELAWTAAESVKLPLLAPEPVLELLPPLPQPLRRIERAATHSLAPPRASTPLPLRI
jgi:hypothetical protein